MITITEYETELARCIEIAKLCLTSYRMQAGGTPYDDDVSPEWDCGFNTDQKGTACLCVDGPDTAHRDVAAWQNASALGGDAGAQSVDHLKHWAGGEFNAAQHKRSVERMLLIKHRRLLGLTGTRPKGGKRGRPSNKSRNQVSWT